MAGTRCGVAPGMTDEFNYDDYFDDEDETRPAPYASGSATSEATAESLSPKARARAAAKVFELLSQEPRTTDEMVVLLGSTNQTVSARVNDLCNAGCVASSGRTRNTRRNRPATVWSVVPGSTLVQFLQWLRNKRESTPTPPGWRKRLTDAALLYRADPTEVNGEHLLETARS